MAEDTRHIYGSDGQIVDRPLTGFVCRKAGKQTDIVHCK
jgi:hypothetical protein